MKSMQQPMPRSFVLSVDKRNRRYMDLLDDYSLEFNQNRSQTIFRILKEYNAMRCFNSAS